ncbi:MAG: DUF723 domain-containing protein [Actinomycetia bacterium]|nr:DUF723 domain-containing protein [Actinomycetes bacterium]
MTAPTRSKQKRKCGRTTAEALVEIAEWAPDLAVDPDWTFEGTKTKVVGQCRIHGESVSPRFESLQKGGGIGCRGCALGRTTAEALAELAEWAPNLVLPRDWVYEGTLAKVVGQCRIHGESVSPRFNSLQRGEGIGCGGCSGRTKWTTDTARAWLAEKFPHLALPRDWEYEGALAKVVGRCRIHGESVSPMFHSLQQGRGIGCPRCNGGRTTAEALAEIADWAPNLAVDPDWVYESNKVKVVGQCRAHGESVSPRFNYIQQGGGIGCPMCNGERTTAEALAELADWAPNLAVDPDWVYEGTLVKVVGQCSIHGESVSPRFNYIQQGRGIGCSGCRLGRTTDEALAEIADWAPNLAVDPDWTFEGTKTKVNGQCRIHGEPVSPRFEYLRKGGGIGCRGCRLGRTSDEALAETARGRLAK